MSQIPPSGPGPRVDPACPYVGILDDRTTRYRLPHHRNHCYARGRPRPLDLSHQQAFCCSATYGACPEYRSVQDRLRRRRLLRRPWTILRAPRWAALTVIGVATATGGTLAVVRRRPSRRDGGTRATVGTADRPATSR